MRFVHFENVINVTVLRKNDVHILVWTIQFYHIELHARKAFLNEYDFRQIFISSDLKRY